jgi:hypothetical protein
MGQLIHLQPTKENTMKQTLQQLEPIDVPLKNLLAWEGNVRTTEPDKSIHELAASIEAVACSTA